MHFNNTVPIKLPSTILLFYKNALTQQSILDINVGLNAGDNSIDL